MKVKTIIAALLISANPAIAETLPDGEVTRLSEWTAMLTGPTTRYRHGALGDDIEASGFMVIFANKRQHFTLGEMHVFEDRRVRLVQLDDDAEPEALIIRSHMKTGAAVVIYDVSIEGITEKAASPDIGQPNRWLNIAGIGDFTGRGTTEIAAVVTPHLTGSLRIYELHNKHLVEVSRIDGFTNHVNGTRALDLARVSDVNGDNVPDITLPRIDGGGLATITFKGGKPQLLEPKTGF